MKFFRPAKFIEKAREIQNTKKINTKTKKTSDYTRTNAKSLSKSLSVNSYSLY